MAAWSNSGQHTELFVRGMRCEKCVDLWTEYGLALRLALDPDKPETARTRKAILSEIEAHEAASHSD
jgi:hypothetical protein